MSVPLHRITRTALIALSSSTVQFCVEKLQNLHQRPRTKIPYQFLIRFYSVLQAFLTHVPWLLKTFEARYIEHHVVNLICNALDKQTSNLQVKYILSSVVQCSAAQCCTVLYCTVLCCAVLYCTVLCSAVLYCTVLCSAVLCSAVVVLRRLIGPLNFTSALSLTLKFYSPPSPSFLPPYLPRCPHTDCSSPSAVRRGGEEGIQPVQLHRETSAQSVQGGVSQQRCECQGQISSELFYIFDFNSYLLRILFSLFNSSL